METASLVKILLPIVVGFALSGLIGNRLLQAWQMRTWLAQQRFLGHEKEYVGLKELADELASLLGARIFHMQRMLYVLSVPVCDDFDGYYKAYRESVRLWNERLTSFYVRLTMLVGTAFALRLERSIHNSLVFASSAIDAAIRETLAHRPVSRATIQPLHHEMNRLQGRAISFNKSLLCEVRKRRSDIYYGKRIDFSVENLKYFSTWQLIKALFIREIDSYSIARTPLDF